MQKATLCYGMGAALQKTSRDEEIRQHAQPVGFFGMQPVLLPRPTTFSDGFGDHTCALGSKLKAMLGQNTPALKQNFWLWDASTDASSNDSESNEELDCEDEIDEFEDENKDEVNSQYDAAKAEVIKQVQANDPNSHRFAAMEAVHQPIPGAKSGREEASMKESLSYSKSFLSDMFRKSSSNNKESASIL